MFINLYHHLLMFIDNDLVVYFNEKDVLATVATLHDPLGKDTQFGNH